MKVQNLYNEVSPFAGVSFVNELFNRVGLSSLIDNELGLRSKLVGYQYTFKRPFKDDTQ